MVGTVVGAVEGWVLARGVSSGFEISDGSEEGGAVLEGAVAEAVGISAEAAGASANMEALMTASESQCTLVFKRRVPIDRTSGYFAICIPLNYAGYKLMHPRCLCNLIAYIRYLPELGCQWHILNSPESLQFLSKMGGDCQ